MNDATEEIDKYLDKEMSTEEINEFEARIKKDAQLAEDLKLQRDMRILYDDHTWITGDREVLQSNEAKQLTSFYRSDEAASIKSTINKVIQENRIKTDRRFQFIGIAAAIAVLISVSTFLFRDTSTADDLYAAYINVESIPSLISRGESNSQLLEKAQLLFEDKAYTKAISAITSYQELSANINPLSYIYLGISYTETAQYSMAIAEFDKLANSQTLQSKKANWYKALVYLKKDDKSTLKELLHKITSNTSNYKYIEAKELLDKI